VKIKCYVNWAYIFTGIVAKLQEQGLVVLEVNAKDMTVVGTIEPEKAGNLWKVAGLHIYEVLK
jgi:hypothetical protein